MLSHGVFRPRYKASKPSGEARLVPVLMLFATVASTVFAGFLAFNSWKSGWIFAVSLLAILGTHEGGHYFAARRWGIRSSLPYFIPFPNIIGTMGAVIRLRDPILERRALFDIGVAGPLAGWILAVLVIVAGYLHAEVVAPQKMANAVSLNFGASLLMKGMEWFFFGSGNWAIQLNPLLYAGWVGMLVTALNLLPMGQLDGGHILFSLFPRAQSWIGKLTFAGLIAASFAWSGWIVWVLLALLFGVNHPPVLDFSEIGEDRRKLGYFVIVVFFLTFIPVPISIG